MHLKYVRLCKLSGGFCRYRDMRETVFSKPGLLTLPVLRFVTPVVYIATLDQGGCGTTALACVLCTDPIRPWNANNVVLCILKLLKNREHKNARDAALAMCFLQPNKM